MRISEVDLGTEKKPDGRVAKTVELLPNTHKWAWCGIGFVSIEMLHLIDTAGPR